MASIRSINALKSYHTQTSRNILSISRTLSYNRIGRSQKISNRNASTSNSFLPDKTHQGQVREPAQSDTGGNAIQESAYNAFSIFRRIFRYSVYGSVIIVVTGIAIWTGTHLWIERVELNGSLRRNRNETFPPSQVDWSDSIESWSGGHLGGGTDPRLPWRARDAIRAAYISMKWGFKDVVPSASSSTSSQIHGPTARLSTPEYIIPEAVKRRDEIAVFDPGYAYAEQCLIFAIVKSAEMGISLFPAEDINPSNQTNYFISPDPAALELEARLAGVRERMGGRRGLSEASKGWERIWSSLISSNPTSSTTDQDALSLSIERWRKLEAIQASRKAGELSLRLAEEEYAKGPVRDAERRRAERFLLWSVMEGLGLKESELSSRATLDIEAEHLISKKVERSSNPWNPLNWLSPSSTEQPSTPNPPSRPELSLILSTLDRFTTPGSISVPENLLSDYRSSRALISSLVSLAHLHAQKRELAASTALTGLTSRLIDALQESYMTKISQRQSSSDEDRDLPSTLSLVLQQDWLRVRSSVLSSYAAELLRALSRPEPDSLKALSRSLTESEIVISHLSPYSLGPLPSLQGPGDPSTRYETETLPTLPTVVKESLTSLSKPQSNWNLIRISGESKPIDRLRKPADSILRDARRAGAMANRLTGMIHEMGCGGYLISKTKKDEKYPSTFETRNSKDWCGGDVTAMAFYERAMILSSGGPVSLASKSGLSDTGNERGGKPQGPKVDGEAWKEAWEDFVRVRERVQTYPLESGT